MISYSRKRRYWIIQKSYFYYLFTTMVSLCFFFLSVCLSKYIFSSSLFVFPLFLLLLLLIFDCSLSSISPKSLPSSSSSLSGSSIFYKFKGWLLKILLESSFLFVIIWFHLFLIPLSEINDLLSSNGSSKPNYYFLSFLSFIFISSSDSRDFCFSLLYISIFSDSVYTWESPNFSIS